MTRALVLRPEPGNARTSARLSALGIAVAPQPLFAVAPVAWTPPDPARFDAVMLTSANAVRHALPGLQTLALPVIAVGPATAAAARAAGLSVVLVGSGDAAALVTEARARGITRLLHLAGRDRVAIEGVEAVIVYRSDPLILPPDAVAAWAGGVALLHSVRAAHRFAALVDEALVARASITVAALSPAVAAVAGDGWAAIHAAPVPTDAALVTLAAALIDPTGRATDKRNR